MLETVRLPEQVRRIREREPERFLLNGNTLGRIVLPVLARDNDRQPVIRGIDTLGCISTALLKVAGARRGRRLVSAERSAYRACTER